jgi:TfoX/Sxy family transcriptional regulator of competence genes
MTTMACDEGLAERTRSQLADRDDVREQKMFGGLAFMVSERMAVGIIGDDLIVRVSRDDYDEALRRPHARPMDFTGRPSKGMVYVSPEGIATDADLARWVSVGTASVMTLTQRP